MACGRLHTRRPGMRGVSRRAGSGARTPNRVTTGPEPGRMPPRGRRPGVERRRRAPWRGSRRNAEVVRQDLPRERPIDVSLRTVEPAVAPYRRLLAAEAKATLRFETPPGQQLQLAWLAAVLMPPSRSAGWRRQKDALPDAGPRSRGARPWGGSEPSTDHVFLLAQVRLHRLRSCCSRS